MESSKTGYLKCRCRKRNRIDLSNSFSGGKKRREKTIIKRPMRPMKTGERCLVEKKKGL